MNLVHRSGFRGEREYKRMRSQRQNLHRRGVERNVARHGERFQVHCRDRAALFVRGERVTMESGAAPARAGGGDRQGQQGAPGNH
jgi:hypothetical protein